MCAETDIEKLRRIRDALGEMLVAEESASKSWYRTGPTDIPVVSETRQPKVAPLSSYSNVVGSLRPNNQVLLYVKPEDFEAAKGLTD